MEALQPLIDYVTKNVEVIGGLAALAAIWIFFKNGIVFAYRKLALFVRVYLIRSDKKRRLATRKEYMETLINLLSLNKKSYRAIIVGPIFLHPAWVVERRNKMSATKSYDDKLYEFIMSKSLKRNNDIRIILRNTERYEVKLNKLILAEDREEFKKDMLSAIDTLWGKNDEKGPDLVCSDVGHFRIDVIFDSAVVTAARLSNDRPVSGGFVSLNKNDHKIQTEIFDQVFDELSSGNSSEVQKLRAYVNQLWTE
jgi:hypothetical protein